MRKKIIKTICWGAALFIMWLFIALIVPFIASCGANIFFIVIMIAVLWVIGLIMTVFTGNKFIVSLIEIFY